MQLQMQIVCTNQVIDTTVRSYGGGGGGCPLWTGNNVQSGQLLGSLGGVLYGQVTRYNLGVPDLITPLTFHSGQIVCTLSVC